MKKLILILLILLISLTTICQAEETNNVKINILSEFELNITNDNDYEMKDISFIVDSDYDDIFQFPSGFNITSNYTHTISYNITADFTGVHDVDVVMQHYRTYNTTVDQTTHNVSIYNNGIDPAQITIHKDDSITFINMLEYPINIHESTTSLWDFDIEINNSHTKEFNAIEDLKYIAKDILIGIINITSNIEESYQHFTSDDETLNFHIVSSLTDADISMQLLDNADITLDWNDKIDGTILVNTDGFISDLTFSVELVNIDCHECENFNIDDIIDDDDIEDWFDFEPNGIDVSSPIIINYEIEPLINLTNQTNVTYEIKVTTSSDNSNTDNFSLFIHINHQDLHILEDSNTTIVLITEDQIKAYMPTYCRENPDKCIGDVQYIYLNVTEKNATNIRLDKIDDSISGLDNKIIQIDSTASNISKEVNKLIIKMNWLEQFKKAEIQNTEQEEVDDKAKSITKWIILTIIIIIILIIGAVYYIYTIQERNSSST